MSNLRLINKKYADHWGNDAIVPLHRYNIHDPLRLHPQVVTRPLTNPLENCGSEDH